MNGLVIKNLSKSFDGIRALHDISIELEGGEFLVLLGPSGCGKSTCLRLIAGLESADSGEIYLNARRIDMLPPKDRQVAMVFQNYSLYPHMTVRKNLAFPLKIARLPADQIKEIVESTAALLGLSEKLDSRPGQLSGGQRQRVALGRAVVRKPSIFLLDEPLSNLDAALRMKMRREIVRIQREMGCTAVYVTHDQAEALSMADRIALLHEGRLVQVGTPEELYKNPNCLFAAQFIGQPQVNTVKASVVDGRVLPFGLDVEGAWISDRDKCVLAVRPEDIRIQASGEFEATVVESEYTGTHYQTTLEYLGNTIVAAVEPRQHESRRKVRFSIDRARVMFFDSATGARLDR